MKAAIPWLLVGALALVSLQATCAQRALDAANAELDSLRTEELAARTEAAGWETRLVEETDGLEGQLREAIEREALHVQEKAELAREVEALGARLTAVMDLYADARGQIVAHAEVHQGPEEYSDEYSPPLPDSITAPLDDGFLTGRVAYFPAPQEFDLAYQVHLALTAAVAEAPDGRGLLTLMPEDPRVALSYGEVLFQRPEPVRFCGFGQKLQWAGYGALGSELLQLAIEALTP